MKKILLYILFLLGFLWTCFSYFEDKYFCSVQWNLIYVSLDKVDDDYNKCLYLMKTINDKIVNYDNNITRANRYIEKWEDISYRKVVLEKINTEKEAIELLQSKLNISIQSFEASLFKKIMKLLDFHLEKEKNQMDKDEKILKKLLNETILSGDKEMFRETIEKLDLVGIKLALLTQILNATSFDQLIPYLRYWVQLDSTI